MGYAGVESAEKAIQGQSLTAGGLAKDIGSGVVTEMGGRVIGKVVGAGVKKLADSGIPSRIYAAAIKTPLSGNWKKGPKFSKKFGAYGANLQNNTKRIYQFA